MQLLFETTVTDVKIDTQSYIRAKQMVYLLHPKTKFTITRQLREMGDYVDKIFENDSSLQDY